MTAQSLASWESYWTHGCLTSCAAAFDGNYGGNIRRLWQQRFNALPDGSRVLDICTGNGAIALIAAAVAQSQQRRFVIDALDLANIDPQRDLRDEARALLHHIRFHPGTDVDATGFDNDSFDLVTGQFALEYTNLPAAVRELTRVTAAGGENMFVLHCDESVIVKTAAEELSHIDLLLQKTRVLQRAGELIARVGDVALESREQHCADANVEALRVALNEATAKVAASIETAAHPEILRTTLGRIAAACRLWQDQDSATALQTLRQARIDIQANAHRLAAVRRVALSQPGIGYLADLYKAQGFTDVWVDTLCEESAGLIGWVLRARRI